MKIALHQITTRGANMEEDMRAYSEAGWSAFELHLSKAREYVQDREPDALGKLVRDSGLKAVGCTGHVVEAFADTATQESNEATFLEALDLMEIVECPIIVFGGDGPEEIPAAADNTETGLKARDAAYRDALAHFAGRVRHLADLAAPRGITMALEMNWCRLCRSVASAADTLEMVDRDNVGFLFDDAFNGPRLRPAPVRGAGGYLPDTPAMVTGFVGWGAGFRQGVRVSEMRQSDVGPTAAEMLGVSLEGGSGRVLVGVLEVPAVSAP